LTALEHLLANRLLRDPLHEGSVTFRVDVGIQQRSADLAHALADVGLREPA